MTSLRRAAGAVLGAAALAVLAGCSSQPGPVASWDSSAAAEPPSGSVDQPVIGVAYPFDLPTHCGILFAQFGGRWSAVTPTAQPHPMGRDQTAGTMTLEDDQHAVFRWDNQAADFVPADGEPRCQ
jgi:hypothetical protein